MTAQETARKTALAAAAAGLWCVGSASAVRRTLDHSARETSTQRFHKMTTTVARPRTPPCAAVGENARKDSVSARRERTWENDTAENSASAATLIVCTTTAGTICAHQ